MKTQLLLCPTTTSPQQAQDYVVIWPYLGQCNILWRMWCSSLRWALQDAAQDFTPFLDEMFGKGNWEIHLFRPQNRNDIVTACERTNRAQLWGLVRLRQVRRKYKLPPWSKDPDPYQNPNW